jgi:hypothetical protein
MLSLESGNKLKKILIEPRSWFVEHLSQTEVLQQSVTQIISLIL